MVTCELSDLTLTLTLTLTLPLPLPLPLTCGGDAVEAVHVRRQALGGGEQL